MVMTGMPRRVDRVVTTKQGESKEKPVREAERVLDHAKVVSTTEASRWCRGAG